MTNTDHIPADVHQDGFIPLSESVDLKDALKAEVVVEKVLRHEGTNGLSIQVNDSDWLPVPEADSIAKPAWDYMHHYNAVVELPPNLLNEGDDNSFRFKVDSILYWDWPQNLLYGVTFRIYYHRPPSFPTNASTLQVAPLDSGFQLSQNSQNQEGIRQVDYVGYYEDADWEGNGQYRQRHSHLHKGELSHHIGRSQTAPFAVDWVANWLPDQPEPMKVYAQLTLHNGLIYTTEAVDSLEMPPRDYSVKLYKPYDQPVKWATRSGEFTQQISIAEDIGQASEYQFIWISWCPSYSNGIFYKRPLVYSWEDPCYDARWHIVSLGDIQYL